MKILGLSLSNNAVIIDKTKATITPANIALRLIFFLICTINCIIVS